MGALSPTNRVFAMSHYHSRTTNGVQFLAIRELIKASAPKSIERDILASAQRALVAHPLSENRVLTIMENASANLNNSKLGKKFHSDILERIKKALK
jgi:AmiR/NasT family two-component response regulator